MPNFLRCVQDLASCQDPSLLNELLQNCHDAVTEDLDLLEKDANGLRASDILAAGRDSLQTAQLSEDIAEAMAQKGTVMELFKAPNSGELPPMLMAAYRGNPLIMQSFLELGMPVNAKATSQRKEMMDGTAYHAVAVGYRSERSQDYLHCLKLLASYDPEAINLADKIRRRPIDIATKKFNANASDAGLRELVGGMLSTGADTKPVTQFDADAFLSALVSRGGNDALLAYKSRGTSEVIMRDISRRREQALQERAAQGQGAGDEPEPSGSSYRP